MILYLIAVMIGFVLAAIYIKRGRSELEDQLMVHVRAGRKVFICIDDLAYIFQMVDGRMQITAGVCNFYPDEPVEVSSDTNVDDVQHH